MARVAFLGLGNMGRGMAARLLAAGHDVTLYNRTRARAEPLLRHGASVAATPREACQGAQSILSMVADDSASKAIWLGADGILAADAEPNCIAIECSTLSHAWVLDLAARCRSRGYRYVDAPVTGLPDAAAAGRLTLLVGAQADDLDAARSVLDAFASAIIRFGPVGTGTAYKLIINMVGGVQIASIAEALALAERAGLDLATVVGAVEASQAASPQVVRNARRILAADHDRNVVFTAALRLKDLEYGTAFARQIALGSPFANLAERIYRELCARGDAQLNESKVFEVCRGQPPQE